MGPSAGNFELRVEIRSAEKLDDPSYRIGDIAKKVFSGVSLTSVYVGLTLGKRTVQTKKHATTHERSVRFENERMLFVYNGEKFVHVRVCNKHHLASDALIGEVNVPLGSELLDGLPRQVSAEIHRGQKSTGTITCQLQMMPV